jgi:hypothetical protein
MSSEERKEERAERKEARFENRQIDEAVVDVERALNQFGDLGVKIDKDEPNLAASHLRRALKDISNSITHLEKADVGKSQAGAVDALNRGSKLLDEAATDLDNGEIDSAQVHYDKASESFDKASAILS